jgi:uncharacterized protein
VTREGPVIQQIWRYPVKSLRGERRELSRVDRRGLLGDRLWAVRDPATGKLGSGKSSRRFQRFPGPPLLSLSSRYLVEPGAEPGEHPPVVVEADGREHPVLDGSADRLLRRLTGVPGLAVACESDVDHFDDGPVSLIGSASLRWVEEGLAGVPVDARRFRPNLVVRTREPFAEEAWCGHRVRLGSGGDAVELEVVGVLQRCIMVTTEQADLPQAPEVLKLVSTRPDQPVGLAVIARVARPGVVRVGDPVEAPA